MMAAALVAAVALTDASAGANRTDRVDPHVTGKVQAGDSGSVTVIQGGNVYILDPDASGPVKVTSGGGYAWPSQDDSGVIVAVRQTHEGTDNPRRLHRMNRKGELLNPPVETVSPTNSLYTGPLMPKVSPDGTYVAYHFIYTGGGSGSPTVAYSYADHDTEPNELASIGGYMSPSWLDNDRALLFEATSAFTDGVLIDPVGPDVSSFWFNDESISSISHGEVSRDLSRFAAVGFSGDQQILALYEMTGPPPTAPVQRCVFTGATEYFQEPTWSPDGNFLLWEEGDGVWAAEVASLDDCPSITAGLLLPGAEDPDWSPAPFSVPLEVRVKLGSPQSLSRLVAGLKPKVTCSAGCKITAKLVVDATTARKYNLGSSATNVGSGSGNLGSAGTKTITVELTGEAKRKLKNATTAFDLRLKVAGSGGGAKDVAKKMIRIAP